MITYVDDLKVGDYVIPVYRLHVFEDYRGKFIELNNVEYSHRLDGEEDPVFIQEDISISYKDVLRGIHGDKKTWKLITCFAGAFFTVVVDCRKYFDPDVKGERELLPHACIILSAGNHYQLLIPPKFGLGILALENVNIFHYKQTHSYEGMKKQFSFKWDDPHIGIDWPIEKPILSKRDGGVFL